MHTDSEWGWLRSQIWKCWVFHLVTGMNRFHSLPFSQQGFQRPFLHVSCQIWMKLNQEIIDAKWQVRPQEKFCPGNFSVRYSEFSLPDKCYLGEYKCGKKEMVLVKEISKHQYVWTPIWRKYHKAMLNMEFGSHTFRMCALGTSKHGTWWERVGGVSSLQSQGLTLCRGQLSISSQASSLSSVWWISFSFIKTFRGEGTNVACLEIHSSNHSPQGAS